MFNDLNRTNNDIPISPIFIMGCHRTGTTLVCRILNSHSRIEIYLETHYYPIFRRNIYYCGNLRRSANLICFINELRNVVRGQAIFLDMELPGTDDFLEALVAPTFEGVLETLLLLYAKKHGKVRGGDKTPQHYEYLPEILEKFPDSPVIFLMRDPRDTVLSMQRQFGTNIKGATLCWNEALYSYQRATRPVHLVRYEELVWRPAEIIEEMCTFIGEEYESSMFRFFDKTPEQIIAQKGGKLLGPVDSGSVGKFQEMCSTEIEQIETECAAGMQLMQYPFSKIQPKVTKKSEIVPPKKQNFLGFLFDRLRYYNWNFSRWSHGWRRWKFILKVRTRYLLALGPLRKNW